MLQLRGRLSAEELAREFEVSVRTIHRDIDQLSAAGVPVYAERGRAGGFQLHEGYRTQLTGLNQDEARALTLAGIGEVARDLGLGAEAATAQLKLFASLPDNASASARQIATRFHQDPIAWYARAEAIAQLPKLADAVWRDRRVSIRYESWKGAVRRRLDPLGLVLKGGLWYLVASVGDSVRVYRASNILELAVLDEPARRPARFDLARFWRNWAADFESRLLSTSAQVRLSPHAMRVLRARFPLAALAAAETQQPSRPRGWIEASVPVEDPAQAVGLMLSLGGQAEVLGPAALRSAVAREARAIAAKYASAGRVKRRRS